MPSPIFDHCDNDDVHESHFWHKEDESIWESDPYRWCDGEQVTP